MSEPGEARACSPPRPGVVPASFESGSSYPANAAIILYGYRPESFDLAQVEVTVDDAPARLVPAEGARYGATAASFLTSNGAAVVSPEPRPGQRVVLRGAACDLSGSPDARDECLARGLWFTATPPDAAPPALPAVTYELGDYSFLGNDCSSEHETRLFARFPPPLEGAAAAPVVYLVEGFADESLAEPVFSRYVGAGRSNPDVILADSNDAVACVRLRAFDLAGHEAPEAAVQCGLPAVPPPPPEEKAERETQRSYVPATRQATEEGCEVAAGPGTRAGSWAASLATLAALAGAFGRRRARAR